LALIVFSGRGMAYYAIYHLFAVSILLALLLGNLCPALRLKLRHLQEVRAGHRAGG
jgi:hypothetical protein